MDLRLAFRQISKYNVSNYARKAGMFMDMQYNDTPRTPNPRRRRRTKFQIFKEAYLPTIILAVTIVLILVFIIGSAVRGPKTDDPTPTGTSSTTSTAPTESSGSNLATEQAMRAKYLIAQAKLLAQDYDYDGALALLETFEGNMADFEDLTKVYNDYRNIRDNMVAWDAADVYNLSFHQLIADTNRAFPDREYGSSYKKNFITISEFNAILQQLYDNGYVLVSLDDFYAQEFNSSSGRDVFVQKQLMLPAGKKPIMLTQTNTNYYTYMIDSNGDGKADAGADGFACSLRYDGRFYNELVNADGSISTGSYDLVPLLEDFIAENPDFSYKGARAIISFSGYDGILGYRVNSPKLSASDLQAERDGAAALITALKDAGYQLACYSFENYDYTNMSASSIQTDLKKWAEQITPWLGQVDILVFAKDGDIGNEAVYTGSKFNVVYNAGFRYFLGSGDAPWNQVNDLYVRHNRINVTGSNLQNHADWFADLFVATSVLDSARS